MPLFSWLFGVFPALWATSFPASLILTINLPYFFQFYSPINNHLLTLHYAHYSPNFLKTPLSFTLSSPLILLAKHCPFSPSPPILFTLSNLTLIPLPTSTLNLNLKPPTCFNLSSITLFDKHLHLYLPFLRLTTFNKTLLPFSHFARNFSKQNCPFRYSNKGKNNNLFLTQIKKMLLYIRHSCCI